MDKVIILLNLSATQILLGTDVHVLQIFAFFLRFLADNFQQLFLRTKVYFEACWYFFNILVFLKMFRKPLQIFATA